MSKFKGYLFAIISSFNVAVNFIVMKYMLTYVHYSVALAAMFGIASVILMFIVIVRNKGIPVTKIKEHVRYLFLAGFFIGLASIAWSFSIAVLGPETTSFIARLNIPFSVILAFLFLKERLNLYEIIGFCIAFFGVLILSYSSSIVLALSAIVTVFQALAFSFHAFFIKKVIGKTDIWTIIFVRTLLAFLMGYFYAVLTGVDFSLRVPWFVFLLVLVGAINGIVINNYFRYKSLEYIGLSKNALLSSTEPILVSIFAFFILGSRLPIYKYVGGIIVIIGVVIVVLHRRVRNGIMHSS